MRGITNTTPRWAAIAPFGLALACTFGGGIPSASSDTGPSATGASTNSTNPGDGDGPGDGADSPTPDGTDAGPVTTNTTVDGSSDGTEDTQGDNELLGQDRLAVQYYLDDIVPNASRGALADSASEPHMHLAVNDSSANEQPELVGDAGRRGLRWQVANARGGAFASVGRSSKIRALHGDTAATFELVLEVTGVHTEIEPWGRVFAWQRNLDTYGMQFGVLTAPHRGGFAIDVRSHLEDDAGDPMARLPLAGLEGRIVLHVVYDSLAGAADRLRLYVGGVRQEPLLFDPPDEGESLIVSGDSYLLLGNRRNNGASFGGTIYYAALYTAALSDAIVANNAKVLAASDDP